MTDSKREAALAKLEAARAKRLAAEGNAEDREVAELERDAACEEALAVAIASHGVGRVGALKWSDGFVLIKAPSLAAYRAWLDAKGNKTEDAMVLISQCLEPKGEASYSTFKQAIDRRPAVLSQALTLCLRLAGHVAEEDAGK